MTICLEAPGSTQPEAILVCNKHTAQSESAVICNQTITNPESFVIGDYGSHPEPLGIALNP